MKTYLLFAHLHSGKCVARVITGHKAVKEEMERLLNLKRYYKNYEVYATT
jgi:hypothetical protein